jgi:hypothetical protein
MAGICFAAKEIIYNPQKGYYEVWDKEKSRIVYIIKDNASQANNRNEIKPNAFPYHQGFPVVLPYGMEDPMSIGDIDKDGYQELAFFVVDGRMRIYSDLGLPEAYWNNPIFSYVAAFADINSDNYLELIGTLSGGGILYGADARTYDSKTLNGFLNPRDTAFYAADIEDIDRDGNYEIIFAPEAESEPTNYHAGLYALGSWGGLLLGFPVIFPWFDPITPAGGRINWASPSTADFDNDGIMEIAVTTANTKFYLIRADGSHYRNWPIVIYVGDIYYDPPAIGDIDNDGKLELATTDSNTNNKIFIFKDDASLMNGFPAPIAPGKPSGSVAYRSPSLADVNGDGKLEIFIANLDGALVAYNYDGTNLPGWPIFVSTQKGRNICFAGHPTIADIDRWRWTNGDISGRRYAAPQ